MLEAGLVGEVSALAADPSGLSRTARQGLGYRQFLAHLEGRCSYEAAVVATAAATRRFARRQRRWFAPRDPRIEWLPAAPEVEGLVRGGETLNGQ